MVHLMDVPVELKYSEDHEWALPEGGRAKVGITDFAQDALGDVVFVRLPEVGSVVNTGDVLGEVESTKSVSDLYAPVAGTVVEVNTDLADSPEQVNEDPYGEGWICVIEMDAPGVEGGETRLMDAASYRAFVAR